MTRSTELASFEAFTSLTDPTDGFLLGFYGLLFTFFTDEMGLEDGLLLAFLTKPSPTSYTLGILFVGLSDLAFVANKLIGRFFHILYQKK